jgi:hypothetical protein
MAKLIGKAKCDQSKKKKLLNKVVKPPPNFSPVISKPKSKTFETGFRKDFPAEGKYNPFFRPK